MMGNYHVRFDGGFREKVSIQTTRPFTYPTMVDAAPQLFAKERSHPRAERFSPLYTLARGWGFWVQCSRYIERRRRLVLSGLCVMLEAT